MIRALNLYAGIGGNRHLWPKGVRVTAVELDSDMAAAYKRLHPRDVVIVADAHAYLLAHYREFDFIWSSPVCTTHSRLNSVRIARGHVDYPDMSLYQEIIFLRQWFKGKWCVENVIPYYPVLIKPEVTIGRHLYWSNFFIPTISEPKFPGIGGNWKTHLTHQNEKEYIHQKFKWMGFPALTKIPHQRMRQVADNMVHPKIGKHILQYAL